MNVLLFVRRLAFHVLGTVGLWHTRARGRSLVAQAERRTESLAAEHAQIVAGHEFDRLRLVAEIDRLRGLLSAGQTRCYLCLSDEMDAGEAEA